MSAALPAQPNLRQIKNQAKDILHAHRRGDPSCCDVLRHLRQFAGCSDDVVLAADVRLSDVQFALAMYYGFQSWNELRVAVEATTGPSQAGQWLPLFDGTNLSRWWIDDPDAMAVERDVLVFRDRAVRAEVGGMSWDDYILSAEIRLRRTRQDAQYCLQLTGNGTQIYCQLMPGHAILGYYCPEPPEKPKGFTPLQATDTDVPEGRWFEYQMKAEGGAVAAIVNGQAALSASVPGGTRGMPGMLVNQLHHTEVRVRNIRIRFLSPTDEQLREYGTDASTNWLRHKEADRQAR
ncbi:MAG TPA: family 16 glycoside hydrolase [Phycisphaerae bacterium]|nr:family 16 glycoside hydrolase [Phycisphaerae bacterium]